MSLGFVAVHQLGKIQLEFMTVAHRVRALHLTEFALKTLIHNQGGLWLGHLAHVAIVLVVDKRKQRRETVAIFETHAASVADFKGAVNLLL
jgi:hypothetical protein